MKPIDAWLEKYHGRPPSQRESEGALQNLLGFVNLLRRAERELDPFDDGLDLVT